MALQVNATRWTSRKLVDWIHVHGMILAKIPRAMIFYTMAAERGLLWRFKVGYSCKIILMLFRCWKHAYVEGYIRSHPQLYLLLLEKMYFSDRKRPRPLKSGHSPGRPPRIFSPRGYIYLNVKNWWRYQFRFGVKDRVS